LHSSLFGIKKPPFEYAEAKHFSGGGFFMNQTNTKKRKSGTKKTASTVESPARLWCIHLAKALLIALAAGAFLLLLGATVAYFSPNPTDWISLFGLAAAAITALVCGYAARRLHGHAALLCGLYAGSALLLLLLLGSLFFGAYTSKYSAWLSCALHSGVLLCTVIGAYCGNHPKKKRKKR
jgi:putative membrane protein (TIGR04086 family)